MKDKLKNMGKEIVGATDFLLETIMGAITVHKNEPTFPEGITIKLNGVPIVLIEYAKINGEDKLVLKRYPNKNIVNDDYYFDLSSYGIKDEDLDPSVVLSILKDIQED